MLESLSTLFSASSWHWSPYAIPALGSTMICALTAVYVFPHRRSPGARRFLWVVAAAFMWVALQAVGAFLVGEEHKILASKFQYLFIASCPPLLLLFALDFNGHLRSRRRWVPWVLLIEPIVVVAFAWTNESHGLIWKEFGSSVDLPLPVISFGPVFTFMHVPYAYAMVLASCGIGVLAFLRTPGWWRQGALVAAAPLVVLAFNALYLSDANPIGGLDPTPIGIAIAAAIIAVAVFRYKAFDLVPIAQSNIIDAIDSAVISLDSQQRIVDTNRVAREIFSEELTSAHGGLLSAALPADVVLAYEQLRDQHGTLESTVVEVGDRSFEGRLQKLGSPTAHVTGNNFILRDVTERLRTEQALQEAQQKLAAANLELKQLASTDSLTGLENRRSVREQLRRELGRADRSDTELGLLMIDIDHFKKVNDAHGHNAGDRVLQAVAHTISASVRTGDVCARWGGEEFVVLAPAVSHAGLMELAGRLKDAVEGLQLQVGEITVKPTISIGAAVSSEAAEAKLVRGPGSASLEVDVLVGIADQRLYRAKDEGRNRAVGD